MKKLNLLLLTLSLVIFQSCQSQQHSDLPDGIYASIVTDKGEILLSLDYKNAPNTVANFVSLAEGNNPNVDAKYKGKKYYDGLKFHRVVPNFVIQGGDPDGNGNGGPGYKFEDEFARDASGNLLLKHDAAGVLSMANAGKNTNGSQFFITHNATPHLDGRHSVFGKVIKGQEVVNAIAQGDIMKKVEIIRIGKDAQNFDAPKIFSQHMTDFELKLKKAEEDKVKALENVKGFQTEKLKYFNSQKAKAKTLPSGLKILITEKGKGGKPTNNAQVLINYAGYFEDARLFDTSIADVAKQYAVYDEQRDQAMGYRPFPMAYSNEAQLIPGFREGMLNMNYGDKALIFIPSHLGYGPQGAGNVIPPNANLIFELEVLENK